VCEQDAQWDVRQGTHAFISFGPNVMIEWTFYGPTPSIDIHIYKNLDDTVIAGGDLQPA